MAFHGLSLSIAQSAGNSYCFFRAENFMRRIAHHDHGQKPERMKFLRIIFGCPEGAGKWRILFFAMLLHRKKRLSGNMGDKYKHS